jgi:2-polyprenyl-6-methoxyphenol hydroxylase-like FAD-dependent oxidoreductase
MKALIAGGGIGGLVTALFLEQAGIESVVFESAKEIRPLGVGINQLPHAVRLLTILGLADKLAATGVATSELVYYSKHGQRIWGEPRGLRAGYHWPQYSIHRGRLQMLLYDAVVQRMGRDHVRTGHHLISFDNRPDGVVARFAEPGSVSNGEGSSNIIAEESGDFLIGADGIHSVVRKTFYPKEGEPPYSGRLLWRAVTEAKPFLTGSSMIMAGYADRKFVAYPIDPCLTRSGDAVINWVADVYVGGEKAPVARDWNRRITHEKVLAPFRDWKFDWLDIPALIQGAKEIFEYPMIDRDPVERWSFGRVTLLGDAAHPMYPIGSNGASQAILDAAALTESLTLERDPVSALARYQDIRIAPTARLVQSNRKQGPEECMQIVEERAPNGFQNLYDVISQAELEEISKRYKQVAGFDQETLNQKGNAVCA